MTKRQRPSFELIKYVDGQLGHGPGGLASTRWPEVQAMRWRAFRYVISAPPRSMREIDRQECRALCREFSSICSNYLEHISWYYRADRAHISDDIRKVAAAAEALQTVLASASPHARTQAFRQSSDIPFRETGRQKALQALLDVLIDAPSRTSVSKQGARPKTFLTATIPSIARLWETLTGKRFGRTVTTASGKSSEPDFASDAAHFVFGVLHAMDDTVTISEVRTAIKTVRF